MKSDSDASKQLPRLHHGTRRNTRHHARRTHVRLFEVDEHQACEQDIERLRTAGFTILSDGNVVPAEAECGHIADEMQELFNRASDAANAYVERETAKFVKRIQANVIKRWGNAEITSACWREETDYATDEGGAHIVAREVIMAIGGSIC